MMMTVVWMSDDGGGGEARVVVSLVRVVFQGCGGRSSREQLLLAVPELNLQFLMCVDYLLLSFTLLPIESSSWAHATTTSLTGYARTNNGGPHSSTHTYTHGRCYPVFCVGCDDKPCAHTHTTDAYCPGPIIAVRCLDLEAGVVGMVKRIGFSHGVSVVLMIRLRSWHFLPNRPEWACRWMEVANAARAVREGHWLRPALGPLPSNHRQRHDGRSPRHGALMIFISYVDGARPLYAAPSHLPWRHGGE
jgi:hypothetical protein